MNLQEVEQLYEKAVKSRRHLSKMKEIRMDTSVKALKRVSLQIETLCKIIIKAEKKIGGILEK